MLVSLQLLCPGLMTTSPCAGAIITGGSQSDVSGGRRMLPIMDESLAMAGLGVGGRMAALLLATAEDEQRLKRRS